MTTDEALAVFEVNPTDFSRPTKILDAGYSLAAEVRRLRDGIKAWEDKEAHEAMSCYLDNEQLRAGLAAARAEAARLREALEIIRENDEWHFADASVRALAALDER